jgi:hypothetical protein
MGAVLLARAALLLTAALLLGAAFGVYQPGSHLTFWLSFAAGFLGAWGCCPLSQPLLERHKRLASETTARPADKLLRE